MNATLVQKGQNLTLLSTNVWLHSVPKASTSTLRKTNVKNVLIIVKSARMQRLVIDVNLEPYSTTMDNALSLSLSAMMDNIGTRIGRNANLAQIIASNVPAKMIASNAISFLSL